MLCVCVGDVMDVVYSVCIVRRGAVGARVWGGSVSVSSEISSPRRSCVECALTSPVIIEFGMLMMYCVQFVVMSVAVMPMVSCCGVSWCYVYSGYGDVLEVFCVYFEMYFCVVCVDDLWRLI